MCKIKIGDDVCLVDSQVLLGIVVDIDFSRQSVSIRRVETEYFVSQPARYRELDEVITVKEWEIKTWHPVPEVPMEVRQLMLQGYSQSGPTSFYKFLPRH